MKTILHVNQQTIVRNRREGTNEAPLIVRNYKGVHHAHEVEILGPSRLINRPHDPLKCGARVWIETDAAVICHYNDGMLPTKERIPGVKAIRR